MKKRNKKKIFSFLVFLLLSLVSFYFYKEEDFTVSSNLKIYYLDVGQADSTLLINNGKTMLIDTGNYDDSKFVIGYLNNLGIKKIDYLIGTHPHEDHIGSMASIIKNFDIDKIYMPDVVTTTSFFENVLIEVKNKGYFIETPKEGDSFNLGEAVVDVLYLDNDEDNFNDDSIILRVRFGSNKFLFMGDASSKVEERILNKNLSADILKVGHHGSSTSTSDEFLKYVNPKYAIISVGKNNSYGHPSELVLKRLNDKNISILRTDECGTIVVESDGNNIKFLEE